MKSSAVDTVLSNTSTALNILKDVAEVLKNVPYLKTIAGVSVQILEIRDQIVSNKDLCYWLIDNVATRSTALIEALEKVKTNGGVKMQDLEKDLERYKNLLIDIHDSLLGLTATGPVKAVIKRDEVKKKLQDYCNRLTEFDGVFVFTRLVNIEAKIDRIDARIPPIPSPSTITNLAPPPPPPSDFFTGREDVLTRMDEYFNPSTASVVCNRRRIFTLYGMGGAGKTQIALKFIEKHSKRFSKIYFVDASTTETLTAGFESIGLNAQLPERTVAAILQWLSNLREEWLLLFDNADDPSVDLRPFIPACTHGNVLITTRNPDMRRHAPNAHYRVGGLELAEALSLLRRSAMLPAEDADENHAAELVEELGSLALAIVQAGSFISSSPGMTFEGYLELYKSNKADLLGDNPGQKVDGYQRTVYTTWEMSFRKLDSLAAQVLQLSSFWHHDKIPKTIFQRALHSLNDPERSIADEWDDVPDFLANFQGTNGQWNELTFQRTINQLNSFSLITSYWNGSYSIHPLVHSWARDRDKNQKDHYATLAARLLALCVPDYAFRAPLGIHLRAWMSGQHDIYAYLDAQTGYQFGKVCLHNAWWSEAEQLFLFVSEWPDGLPALDQLAVLHLTRGRLADAEKLLSLVVDKATLSHGEDDPSTLLFTANLALLYREQGRLDEAEELDRTVLAKRKKTLGEDHHDTMYAMFRLGVIYSEQGRWKEAEKLLISALEGWKKIVAEEHRDVLLCMGSLAVTYAHQKRLGEAEKMIVKALEGAKRTLGDDHLETIRMASNLAGVYVDQGRWVEAQAVLKEVISKRKTILGEAHSDTQTVIGALENVKAKQMEATSVRPKSRRYAWMRALVKVFLVADRRQRPS